MSPGPGPPRSRGCAEPGYCELPDPVTGEPHGAEAQQERDNALSGADRRAGEAGSRARNAGQETDRARKAAGSARAELHWARQGRGRQAQVREDAARDQARPPAASEAGSRACPSCRWSP